VDVCGGSFSVAIVNNQVAWASEIAKDLLELPLPRRWAHTQGVARQARSLAPILGENAQLLEAAAWLHDIGYNPRLRVLNFHSLDGARYLRDVEGADDLLCRLVAGHSCASIAAEWGGFAEEMLREFPPASEDLSDAMTYCDMTTGPDGELVSVGPRLAEIRERRGSEESIIRWLDLAGPPLIRAVRETERRLQAVELWVRPGCRPVNRG
jgi:HD domain-containing protein